MIAAPLLPGPHAMTSFAFLSNNSFLKAPALTPNAPFGVAGVAWDGAVTNRPGARFGPRAIREASYMLCDAIHQIGRAHV